MRREFIGLWSLALPLIGWCGSVYGADKDDPPVQRPQAGPDLPGGFASTHLIVRVKPGVRPVRHADGGWSFRPAPRRARAGVEAAPTNAAIAALERTMRRSTVSGVARLPAEQPANQALARQLGLDRYYKIHVPLGSDTPALGAQLAAFTDFFESVQLDGIGSIATAPFPDDPDFDLQWNMHNTGQSGGTPDADVDAREAWELHQGLSAVTLAVIDIGIQANHPDLFGRVISGYNTFDENDDTSAPPTPFVGGHGTHVAGIAAATGNEAVGVAGVNWNATILPMVCVNDNGSGPESDCAEAIMWATDHGADIINMSLQYNGGTDFLRDAVAYAYDSGVLPIAATGNNASPGVIAYPAKFPKCMAVGATDHVDNRASFSNNGPEIDVVAPGKAVYSLDKDSGYSIRDGTSMATPHVSGLAALIRSYNPGLSIAQVEDLIRTTAEDKGAAGFDEMYGWGRINARLALVAATPVPGDTNGDGVVNVSDLLEVIQAWGDCPADSLCPADLDQNGSVDVTDLLIVLQNWGCAEPSREWGARSIDGELLRRD